MSVAAPERDDGCIIGALVVAVAAVGVTPAQMEGLSLVQQAYAATYAEVVVRLMGEPGGADRGANAAGK